MTGGKDSRVIVGGTVWARAEAISMDYKRILGNQFKTKWLRKQDPQPSSSSSSSSSSPEVLSNYCWKCGESGHVKRDCPSPQTSSLPSLLSRPVIELNVCTIGGTATLDEHNNDRNNNMDDGNGDSLRATTSNNNDQKHNNNLFDDYCSWLSTSLERNTVTIHKASYSNNNNNNNNGGYSYSSSSGSGNSSGSNHHHHTNSSNANNWNRHRKSIFIVGTHDEARKLG